MVGACAQPAAWDLPEANAGLVWDPDQCVLADCPDPNVTEESSFESSRHFAA